MPQGRAKSNAVKNEFDDWNSVQRKGRQLCSMIFTQTMTVVVVGVMTIMIMMKIKSR
jgi:hypothetical protein